MNNENDEPVVRERANEKFQQNIEKRNAIFNQRVPERRAVLARAIESNLKKISHCYRRCDCRWHIDCHHSQKILNQWPDAGQKNSQHSVFGILDLRVTCWSGLLTFDAPPPCSYLLHPHFVLVFTSLLIPSFIPASACLSWLL